RHFFTGLAWLYAILGAFLPYALILIISFMKVPSLGFVAGNFTLDNYIAILTDGPVHAALYNSLILGFASASLISILGFLIAYIVTKTRVPGRALLDYITILP